MSASIMTRPTGKGKPLGVSAPSSFIQVMSTAFGKFPVKLNESHIPILRGIVACAKENVLGQDANSYQALIEEIYQNGEIEVFAEY